MPLSSSPLYHCAFRSVQPVPPIPRGEKPYSRPRSENEYLTIVPDSDPVDSRESGYEEPYAKLTNTTSGVDSAHGHINQGFNKS